MPDTPVDLRYSKDHLWARPGAGAGLVRVGVTDFAQQSLGDVVEVPLPRPGDTVKTGEACGDIESVKSVSDLTAPVTGTVRTRNDELTGTPELVNTDPYGATYLAVTDIEAAHRELTERGLTVSGIRHKSPIDDWKGGWQPGTDPERRDYASLADFADPDGNTWVIQEIGYRPPRGASGGRPLD